MSSQPRCQKLWCASRTSGGSLLGQRDPALFCRFLLFALAFASTSLGAEISLHPTAGVQQLGALERASPHSAVGKLVLRVVLSNARGCRVFSICRISSSVRMWLGGCKNKTWKRLILGRCCPLAAVGPRWSCELSPGLQKRCASKALWLPPERCLMGTHMRGFLGGGTGPKVTSLSS